MNDRTKKEEIPAGEGGYLQKLYDLGTYQTVLHIGSY